MIINIQAFKKNIADEKKSNIIHRESDRLSGNRPIDLISETNPIVIMDEPQSMGSDKSKVALETLKPMVTLRYSATHKELHNLMYRLTPVDAYQQRLVKGIEVSSILSEKSSGKPYIKLMSVSDTNGYKAKIEIWMRKKDGSLTKKVVTLKPGDDIWDASKEVDYYKDQGLILSDIDCEPGNETVTFIEGTILFLGEAIGETNEEAMKRAQIRETIDLHLRKESSYIKKGIKVLSLIFIDRVKNYRDYNDDGIEIKGKYALWFEEEYKNLIEGKYKSLLKQNLEYFSKFPDDIHDGYFSIDNKKRIKDSSGTTKSDEDTYNRIMKDKERLLSLDDNLRFIFSHSALKEGWDNPNVFQVCTLVESKDNMTKRQKIGRGLRICVNQDGERVNDPKYNRLSVIANESYKDFARSLQKELEREAGFKFGVVEQISFSELEITTEYGHELKISQDESVDIYNYLKKNDYLNKKNKVTEKFFRDVDEDTFVVPDRYSEFREKIINQITTLSKEIEIKDANDKVKVSINKRVYVSPAFKEVWNKINQKTFYSVNMDIESFIKSCGKDISDMKQIEKEKVRRERSKLDLTNTGVVYEARASYANIGNVIDFEAPKYPDLVRRLQESTGLTRKTITDILVDSGRLKEFNFNPELFIKRVSAFIRSNKKKYMIDSLQYYKTDEFYTMSEVFEDDEMYGYRSKNVLDISEEKNIYDHVIFDSIIEKQFAMDAENDENVLLYAKLPLKFKIDTPYGNYSPDWVVVIQSEEEHKLYFVAETKGSRDKEQLKGMEHSKIIAGRKHFEVLDNEVKYEFVKELRDLID